MALLATVRGTVAALVLIGGLGALSTEEWSQRVKDLDAQVQANLEENRPAATTKGPGKAVDLTMLAERQKTLRTLTASLAQMEGDPSANALLKGYFQQGSWPLVIATAYGVCEHHRAEFGSQLEELHLLEQVSGTPDEAWMKSCIRRMAALRWMTELCREQGAPMQAAQMVRANALTDDPEIMSLVYRAQGAGQTVAEFLRLYLRTSGLNPEKIRRLRFYLVLFASYRNQYPQQIEEIEQIVRTEQDFITKIPLWDRPYMEMAPWSIQEGAMIAGGVTFLRINPVNLRFLTAEIMRDGLEDFRTAQKIYEELALLPPAVRFLSIHTSESTFIKPAALAARSELDLLWCKADRMKRGCEGWAQLTFEAGKEEIQGGEEREFFCQHTLRQLDRYCPLYVHKIFKKWESKASDLPPECREAFQKWQEKPTFPYEVTLID